MSDPDPSRTGAPGAAAADPPPAPPPVAAEGSGASVSQLPEPVLSRQNRLRLSLVWIVPIVAMVIGIVLVARAILQTGPEIGIEFRSAEGIEPGRTELRFREVVVGRVKRVTIQPGRQAVRVTVALDKSVESLAVDDSRFWVVRPRIGTGGVSGLGTVLSGAYIAVDAGESDEARREFTGMDAPPLVLRGERGRSVVLRADDLGSLDVGSPVYHRRIRVGRVVGYSLASDGKALEIRAFIESPNESLVTGQSRFWHASGVDLSLNASGLTLNTQSLASVVIGGLAFANSPGAASAPAAVDGARFELHATQRAALAPEDGEPLRVRMVFNQSLRGLDEGAPIDLLGVELGAVRGIALQDDAHTEHLPVEVIADIYPGRLGKLRERLGGAGRPRAAAPDDRVLLKRLIERGLRAQVRTGSLLTGRLYVALEFMPKAEPASFDSQAAVPTLPTVPGTLADVQPQLAEVVARMSKVRFDEIGADLQEVLRTLTTTGSSLQSTLASAEAMFKQLTPEAQRTLADVQKTLASAQQAMGSAERNLLDANTPLQRNATQTLTELQRAAQAMRVLADYLQRHPESLLRGKPADELPPPATEAPR